MDWNVIFFFSINTEKARYIYKYDLVMSHMHLHCATPLNGKPVSIGIITKGNTNLEKKTLKRNNRLN